MMTDGAQVLHSEMSGLATPFNRALGVNAPGVMLNPQMPFGLQALDGLISFRAQEIRAVVLSRNYPSGSPVCKARACSAPPIWPFKAL